MSLGVALFCTGLESSRGVAWWERFLWGAPALSFVWQLVTPAPKPLTDEGRSQAAPPVADLRAAGLKLAVTSLAGVAVAWLAFRSTDLYLLSSARGSIDVVLRRTEIAFPLGSPC